MKKIIKSVLILSLTIIFFVSNITEVQAIQVGGEIEQKLSTKTYEFNQDVTFTGTFSSHSTYFNVEKWWDNTSFEANIYYCINQLITEEQNAYIKLSINGIPFYSQKIFYSDNDEVECITYKIPEEFVKEGSNELKVETYLRETEATCIDNFNVANWFVIKKTSNIKAIYNNIISKNNISNFPYPFIKNIDFNEEQDSLLIVVPDDYTDSQLTAAFLLNSYISKLNREYKNKISLIKYSDFNKNSDVSSIYIGKHNSFNEINMDNNFSKECLIKVTEASYSNNPNIKSMFILCDDDSNLIDGIKLLQNKEILSQINNDSYVVSEDLEINEEVKSMNGKKTFKDLGINEIQLTGAFRKQSSVSYSIPKNKAFSDEDKIKIFMRYSDNLDFDKALVTIYVNNTPIGSKKLEKEKTEGDEVELLIPSDVKLGNSIDVKIAFDLEVENNCCETKVNDMPWALVTGDSYIYLSDKEDKDYYFSNYSFPFVIDGSFSNTKLIVPNNLSSFEINELGKLVGFIGKDITNNSGEFEVISNSNVSSKDKKNNLIIYGSADNNKIIKEINDDLWFKYDNSYSKFLSNEKLQLTDSYSRNIANFQLDISSFDEQKAMLVLTSPNQNILMNSLRYLNTTKDFQKLSDDCALISEDGEVKNFKFKKETKQPSYERIESLDTKAKGILLIAVLILIFAVVSLVLYFLKNSKKINLRNLFKRK